MWEYFWGMRSDQFKDDWDLLLVCRGHTAHAEKPPYHCDGCCDDHPDPPLLPQLLGELLASRDIPLAEENLMPQSHAPSQRNPHPMTHIKAWLSHPTWGGSARPSRVQSSMQVGWDLHEDFIAAHLLSLSKAFSFSFLLKVFISRRPPLPPINCLLAKLCLRICCPEPNLWQPKIPYDSTYHSSEKKNYWPMGQVWSLELFCIDFSGVKNYELFVNI